MNSAIKSKASRTLIAIVLVFLALVIFYFLLPLSIVPTGSRGVRTTFGKPEEIPLNPGIYFRIPIAQKIHLMNVQIQKAEGEGDAASKDLQSVHTRVAINYHLDPNSAVVVFRDIAPSTFIAAERIISPAAQESVKAITARFTAEELITKRTEVRDNIGTLLKEKMQRHGLILDEFAIVNFSFSRSFSDAIEAKVKAEQDKLKAERDLQRIEVEAKQRIASARAEAEALSLQRQQVTPELIALRQVENDRKAIEKWDGKLPQMTGVSGIPFIGTGANAK